MTTFEIPRDQWRPFFNNINQQYRNWQTTIEVMGQDLGDQPEAEGAPLQEINFEDRGSETGDIEIALGETPDAYQTHRIGRPERIRVTDSRPGVERDVQIEAADGLTVLVHIRPSPELPQTH
ncbi:MAG: DUF5335 family protein [Bacillota bacterium]